MRDVELFRSLYMGEWPDPPQCQVRTQTERCQNEAKYVLLRTNHEPAEVCDLCLPSWVHEFTKSGPITIERL